ncbi:glycosyl hydrolase [Labilibaculum filiforme]|uniref:Glycosyl hydrolase n=1 Tax=Labilibaculum filiforme TaxID=1940526 RepID=A0A2N3I3J5_9BACT|nr:glycoside hydrolase family 3 C-terminal domain-containing protein [Labilibaculum filiforme]PKQ64884.1 glycosyl hydrolase [Labilibaculum filiforme]
MKKLLFVVFLFTLISFNQVYAQTNNKSMDNKIEDILKQLTLKEKLDLCHAQSKFSSKGVARLGIPEIWMSDGPHGVRAEIAWDSWEHAGWTNDSCTAFPALTCLAATFNTDLSYKYGKAIGEEARYRKKDILLGPGVNIYRTPLNGRNFEYMGEDPYLASKMVVPYIHGVQENGVAACVKHYALNNQEHWRDHINVEISDRALYEIYLPAFKAAVQEGKVWSIMGAYNQFRGQYCCHNELLVNKILKGDWAFDGVLVTDWGATHDTKQAALYGLDIEMGTGTDGLTSSQKNAYDNYFMANPLLKMVKAGEIDESVIDEKVRRVLRLMFRTTMNKSRPFGSMNSEEHFNVAREIAQEGIVLLKNKNNFFPIDPKKTQTIAVIGENATKIMTLGGGSSELKTIHEISPLEGIQKRFKNAKVLHAMGYASGPSVYGRVIDSKLNTDSLKTEAIKIAKKADIVLFVGGLNKNHHQDCEGDDRKHFSLPFGQDNLLNEILKVNSNTAVILVSGNAVEMPWLSKVDAVLQTWYLGSEAGNAIADIISGDINPSGKLPFSFPVKLEDNAAHSFGKIAYPGDGTNQEYKEDILVGYRWHDTKNIKPLYAFGYGLSYTSFTVLEAQTDQSTYQKNELITVSCEIKNTGDKKGAEVIQLYVSDLEASVLRPLKELKSFKKIVLNPGESKTITLEISTNDLAYFDDSMMDWKLEKGRFKLLIGTSSQDIEKTITIEVN